MFIVTLTLPNQPVRTVAQIDAPSAVHAAAEVVRQFSFLPPAYVWIDDVPLAVLRMPPATPRGTLTQGQQAHRDRIQRQRRAERWRQHWIDKGSTKRTT